MAGAKKFGGVFVRNGYIKHKDGEGPLAGARATVDSAGAIDRRLSATRVVLTGGLGLFWKKKVDHRETYLLVEGDGFAFVEEVPQKRNADARKFAAWITAEGAKLARSSVAAPPPVAASAPAPPAAAISAAPEPEQAVSVADELAKFGSLLQAGLITDYEFELQKSRLLGTPPPPPHDDGSDSSQTEPDPLDEIEDAVVVLDHGHDEDDRDVATGALPEIARPESSETEPPPSGPTPSVTEGRATASRAPEETASDAGTYDDVRPTGEDPTRNSEAGWHPDPYEIHEHRYWDGTAWTEHVSNGGTASVSPPPY